ncbi:24704_t:CDS:2 [Dentiscutata erythropus]|uniref:24704_t:CDS:1 n=1 Tax=Dentiscutata erythropus TaxID=1348616 RepID=A0A9N9DV62_9GLOM|nr:24704_t:CDS:2 [Dentiscutata erythropus]
MLTHALPVHDQSLDLVKRCSFLSKLFSVGDCQFGGGAGSNCEVTGCNNGLTCKSLGNEPAICQ